MMRGPPFVGGVTHFIHNTPTRKHSHQAKTLCHTSLVILPFLVSLRMPELNAGTAGESSGDRTAQQIIDATRAQLSWMEAAESEVRSSF